MVHDPLHPGPAHLGDGTVRDDRRILPGNCPLIGQPVGHPALQLAGREPALMHQLVKRMVGVVGRAERAETLGQRIGRQRPLQHRNGGGGGADRTEALSDRIVIR